MSPVSLADPSSSAFRGRSPDPGDDSTLGRSPPNLSGKGLSSTVVPPVSSPFPEKTLLTYKSALSGKDSPSGNPGKKWIAVGEHDIVTSIDNGIRSLQVSDSLKSKLCKPWTNTVVIRLLGKSIGYSYLCHRLNAMWRPVGSMHVVDIDKDCFIVKFSNEADYFKALTAGPWMILEHYLIVQQWDPCFRVSDSLPKKMVVWVRFPHLPILYYHPEILSALGNLIGRCVRVDFSTQNADRGKFARLAIEIDLNEPLIPGIKLDGAWQKVEYENIPMLCFDCGKVGHESESCPCKQALVLNSPFTSSPTPTTQGAAPPMASQPDSFGPWMVVARKHRRQRREIIPEKASGSSGKIDSNHDCIKESSGNCSKSLEVKVGEQHDSRGEIANSAIKAPAPASKKGKTPTTRKSTAKHPNEEGSGKSAAGGRKAHLGNNSPKQANKGPFVLDKRSPNDDGTPVGLNLVVESGLHNDPSPSATPSPNSSIPLFDSLIQIPIQPLSSTASPTPLASNRFKKTTKRITSAPVRGNQKMTLKTKNPSLKSQQNESFPRAVKDRICAELLPGQKQAAASRTTVDPDHMPEAMATELGCVEEQRDTSVSCQSGEAMITDSTSGDAPPPDDLDLNLPNSG
ncbi:hypothetical protein LINPERHAP1_LOCUS39061 [Linum perenne]